jgi:hypothetical protein
MLAQFTLPLAENRQSDLQPAVWPQAVWLPLPRQPALPPVRQPVLAQLVLSHPEAAQAVLHPQAPALHRQPLPSVLQVQPAVDPQDVFWLRQPADFASPQAEVPVCVEQLVCWQPNRFTPV